MSNILTAVRQALIAKVQGITTDNGFNTNLGHQVKTGWLNEVLPPKGPPLSGLPELFALIQKAPNRPPERGPAAIKAYPGFFVIGLVKCDLSTYEDALDAMELDICQALLPASGVFPQGFPTGVTGLSLGASEPFPPGDGQRYAGVLVPIHITTIIQERIRR
ncbi:hypothetical protein [Pseudomonas sp. zfem005]|uniref:hypothetical protein n=1 Tax=Pseudomonas sp. zfem005 TaxID=3078200 RepID=UPI002929DB65|nr:hypothetical protein [Pseudomonas sp. zfem005]MDU9416115.1 hypothetical protein [Pseudomonas sp. zfem005]